MADQDQIFELLFDKDEISWQSILYELVRTEQMDPWDIDMALLAQKFIEMVNQLKKMDFRVSGKIILAAAILLKIKSDRLLSKDISNLDRMFAQTDGEEEGLLDEITVDDYSQERELLRNARLIPKTPQPRKRKVSIFDLVDALQKAIEVKKRRVMRDLPPLEVKIPEKKIELSSVIQTIYSKIKNFFSAGAEKLTFARLIPSENKYDKIYTFIPLLHLTTQRKIDLLQEQHFGEIEIRLLSLSAAKETEKELNELNRSNELNEPAISNVLNAS